MGTHAIFDSTMGRQPSYQDIVELPEHLVGQILDGELVVQPRPSGEHGMAAMGLAGALVGPFHVNPDGGWWLLPEPECHLANDVLVPDLAGWRRKRLPGPFGPYFTVAPDWVCEILSPSTAQVDRIRKMRIYAREGVGHVWLVDPAARTLEAFSLQGKAWTRLGAWADAERCKVPPFETTELDLSTLWPHLPDHPSPRK